MFELFRYGVLPDSLKPTQKVKSSIKREDSSSEEENDSEQKVMEEVKRYISIFYILCMHIYRFVTKLHYIMANSLARGFFFVMT
jgi:hypothetical protein